MTRIRLTDTQLALLTAACHRHNGSLVPAPTALAADPDAISRAIAQLLKRGLVEERSTTNGRCSWRSDDAQHFDAHVTDAIRAHLGIAAPEAPEPTAESQPRESKQAKVVTLLRRPEGATLDDIIAATGWLPHSGRAALTGLRKKGHAIAAEKEERGTRYRIGAAA